MADDLAAFFAKKKAKSSKKKAIRVDEVAEHLEAALRVDKDPEEDENKKQDVASFLVANDEDSEWIDYNTKPQIIGETVGTFNFSETQEEEQQKERTKEKTPSEKKTWNIPNKDEPVKETVIHQVTTTQSKFEAYRPPTSRTTGNSMKNVVRQKVDLQNEEMFPSLGDADKIEKQQNEDQKRIRAEEKAAPPASNGPSSQDVRASQQAWAPRPTPVEPVKVATPPPAPETRPVIQLQPPRPQIAAVRPPPPPNSTGIMNAKGEWIVLEEKKEPEQPKKEPVSWRKQEEPSKESAPHPPSQVQRAPAAPKANPFGAAKPVTQRLPPAVQAQQNQWRQAPAEVEAPPPRQGAYQPPGRRGGGEAPAPRNWRDGPPREVQSNRTDGPVQGAQGQQPSAPWRSSRARQDDRHRQPAAAHQERVSPSQEAPPPATEEVEEGWSQAMNRRGHRK